MIEIPDVVGGFVLVEKLELQRLLADLQSLRDTLNAPKEQLSVQDARARTLHELQRSADSKLEDARAQGYDAAAAIYESELSSATAYCAQVRDLVLRAKLALPNGTGQSYDLLKQALEIELPEVAHVG